MRLIIVEIKITNNSKKDFNIENKIPHPKDVSLFKEFMFSPNTLKEIKRI